MDSQSLSEDAGEAAKALRLSGFAVVRGIFGEEEVREAETLIDEMSERLGSPVRSDRNCRFAGDMLPLSMATEQEGLDQLEIKYAASIEPRLLETRMFERCQSFARAIAGNVSRSFDHVIVKASRNRSISPWHQDAAFDHVGRLLPAFRPLRLHFWIPLQDASVESGCMEYIAGSHLRPLLRHKRYLRKGGDFGLCAEGVDESRRVACPVPAGGLTIHTPWTLHYCGRNASDRPRKAWIIQFSPFGRALIALKGLAGFVPRPPF